MNSNQKRPFTEYLSPEGREKLARSRDEVLKEHWGPDRFEAYRSRFTPPAWLAAIPQLPAEAVGNGAQRGWNAQQVQQWRQDNGLKKGMLTRALEGEDVGTIIFQD